MNGCGVEQQGPSCRGPSASQPATRPRPATPFSCPRLRVSARATAAAAVAGNCGILGGRSVSQSVSQSVRVSLVGRCCRPLQRKTDRRHPLPLSLVWKARVISSGLGEMRLLKSERYDSPQCAIYTKAHDDCFVLCTRMGKFLREELREYCLRPQFRTKLCSEFDTAVWPVRD